MAITFKPEELQDATIVSGPGTAPASAGIVTFSPEDLMGSQAMPSYADGIDANSPVNQSPLSFTDRLALSTGQVGGSKRGNIEYLKGKGFDVSEKDGNLVVKDPKDKLWKYVDEQDAWTLSAAMGDVADIIPDVAQGAATVGLQALGTALTGAGLVGTAATGGAAAPLTLGTAAAGAGLAAAAQGITAGAKAALGRYLGTYAAEDMNEVAADVGLESLLALGGQAVAIGAKPTAAYIGSKLSRFADKVPLMPDSLKDAAAKTIGLTTGMGEDRAARMFDSSFAKPVAESLRSYGKEGADNIIGSETNKMVKVLEGIGDDVMELGGQIWRNGSKGVKEAAAGKAKFDPTDMTMNIMREGEKLGLFIRAQGVEGLSERALPTFRIAKPNEIAQNFGEISDKSVGLLRKYAANIKRLGDLSAAGGDEAVDQIMKARQGLAGLERSIIGEALDPAKPAPGVVPVIKNMTGAFDAYIDAGLPDPAKQAYGALRQQYSDYSAATDLFKESVRQARDQRTLVPFERFLNKLQARPGKSAAFKSEFDDMIALAQNMSPEIGKKITAKQKQLMIHDLTRAVAPRIRSGIASSALAQGGFIGSMMAFGPSAAIPLAAGVTASSPRAAFTAAPPIVNGLMQVKSIFANLNKRGLDYMYKNPQIAGQLLQLPFEAHAAEQQTQQMLQRQIEQAAAPVGGQ